MGDAVQIRRENEHQDAVQVVWKLLEETCHLMLDIKTSLLTLRLNAVFAALSPGMFVFNLVRRLERENRREVQFLSLLPVVLVFKLTFQVQLSICL